MSLFIPRTVRTWRGLRCVLRLWNVDPRRIDCALLSRSLSGLNNSLRESNNYNSLFTRESPATWRTYLSTNVGGDDGDNWYDMDTPEFVQIVKEHQAGGGNSLIVDVREPQELVESGQIPGTINIPLGSVEEALSDESEIFQERLGVPKPAQDTDIVFHCAAGVRSVVAIEIAHKLGYSKSRHYKNGYLGWEEHLEAGQ